MNVDRGCGRKNNSHGWLDDFERLNHARDRKVQRHTLVTKHNCIRRCKQPLQQQVDTIFLERCFGRRTTGLCNCSNRVDSSSGNIGVVQLIG